MKLLPDHILKSLEELEHLKDLPAKMDRLIQLVEELLEVERNRGI